tara:strand:- start:2750 stop:4150 length:1401 start_codon:yes stop_codon:yes gene_type:complete
MRVIFLGLLVFSFFTSSSQAIDANLLTFEDFISRVKEHHPMAKQASLKVLEGDAALLESKGAFDPKFNTQLAQKYFEDKDYYSIASTNLRIPSWFAAQFEAGYDQNDGVFLNPENQLPSEGLLYAGISLPLGKGLIIDQRRAMYRRAKIYKESSLAEQQLMLNELIYEAGKVYWQWFEAYNIRKVFQEAVVLAKTRFEAVKQQALLGDKPFIDTVEARIQYQNRRLSLQQANLDFRNSGILVSIFLWEDGLIPLELDSNAHPDLFKDLSSFSDLNLQLNLDQDSLLKAHPSLRLGRFKIDQLEIDRKWKREQLKPSLDLKYNALASANGNDISNNYSVNNYTWGFKLAIPLYLRKERGALKLNQLKIQDAELDLGQKQQALNFKVQSSINEWQITAEQLQLYQKTLSDYQVLLQGERNLFNNGESSLFLVNSREWGFINARLKMIELLVKNRKARLSTYYSLASPL